MTPGTHVAVLADRAEVGVEGRLMGLELRDTLLVLRPGPAAGFVFLFRVPITEPTVVAQVLATGTGALDLDSCRVEILREESLGRWPPNVVLVHAPGCRKAGVRRVHSGVAHRSRSGGKSFGGDRYKPPLPDMTYADKDGLETASAYECEEGCPVKILDGLSGDRPVSGRAAQGELHGAPSDGYGGWGDAQRALPNDAGGASRFYPQFESEAELLTWLGRLMGDGRLFRDG